MLGGSFMQGGYMPDEETLPWLLQNRLPKVVVSNYGNGDDLQGLLTTEKEPRKSMEQWHSAAEGAFADNRKVLQRYWKQSQKKMTDNQAPIYPFLTRYADMLISTNSRKVSQHRNFYGLCASVT